VGSQVLKLDGKGAPRLGGKGRGNQFVTVKVDIPTSVSREEKELLQKLQVRRICRAVVESGLIRKRRRQNINGDSEHFGTGRFPT
jgi:DnaJ-class molecular chaperone